MNPTLDYTTRCRVPGCTKKFVSSALDIPIIGQPGDHLDRFMAAVGKHMQAKHPSIVAEATQLKEVFVGFLISQHLELQDPALIEMRESIRALLFRMSRRNNIPDSVIDGKIAELGFEEEDAEGLRALLQDLRDLLTEQGRYAPLNGSQPAPLVTPV
jgi:hypothetical protein